MADSYKNSNAPITMERERTLTATQGTGEATTAATTTTNKQESAVTNSNTNTNSALNGRAVARDLFSASIGSVFCCYVGQPLDTIKVRMQTMPETYNGGIMTTVRQIMKAEGVAALWKGAVPTAGGMMLENGMAFGVNEGLKRAFPDDPAELEENGMPNLIKPFFLGAFTGCCSAMVLLPSEVIKAKTQVVVGSSTSSTDIIKEMIRRQGVKSMFTGLDAQLARDASFYAFFFGGYEMFKYAFATYCPNMPDECNYFLSGGFAGMLGWGLAMPLDVPKTNVQSSWNSKVVGSYVPQMSALYRERGFLAFYSGLAPTLARAFPANAALFLGVEMGKKLFDRSF
jgi:solute carrier family 25 ornithine transporter 2/15